MLRRELVPLVVLAAIAVPSPARADGLDEPFGLIVVSFLVVEGVAVAGGTATAIGTSVQLTKEEPRLGWPIASMVTGGIGVVWGGILSAMIASGGEGDPVLTGFAVAPIVVGAATIGLAAAAFVKRHRARLRHFEEEIDQPDDEWTLAPIMLEGRAGDQAPGIGAAVRF